MLADIIRYRDTTRVPFISRGRYGEAQSQSEKNIEDDDIRGRGIQTNTFG